MIDKIGIKDKERIDRSWDIEKLAINYRDIILSWLLWLNTDNPAKLVDDLIDYRKTH